MSKQLLISIRPQHLYNILTGKKPLEIRKQIPLNYVGWVNCYCTLGKPYLTSFCGRLNLFDKITDNFKFAMLNGSIPCRFWFDEYDLYNPFYFENTGVKKLDYLVDGKEREKMCLEDDDIRAYGKGKDLYAMHIKKLEIFEKPKALGEFNTFSESYEQCGFAMSLKEEYMTQKERLINRGSKIVTHAPQNFMYVEVEE